MKVLPMLEGAFLTSANGIITGYGLMKDCPEISDFDKVIDCTEKVVLPSWCDSHTHLVYAGTREDEFKDRINGLSYEEIARRGGGILNSVKKLQESSEDELYRKAAERLEQLIFIGTGAIEIKSGYGLTTEAEIKMLKVIKKLKENYPVAIKSTFLGAHAVPKAYKDKKAAYLDLVINEMLPKIAELKLADYVDIFCEKDYFSPADTEKLLKAASKFKLLGKIHVNQFSISGGVKVGCENNARTVDHLELLGQEDIDSLKKGTTMPVALPGCSFFLGIPYTPVKRILENGLPLAIASDYNPGSSPSGNMNFILSLACIKLKMTPEEAINAATINGAYAMGIEKNYGSITKGKTANLIITKKINSYNFLPYAYGNNNIAEIVLNGIPLNKKNALE